MIKLSDELHIPTFREIEAERNAAKAAEPRRVKRYHAAAKVDRTNSTWLTNPETANYMLRLGIRILRARARQMCGDDPLFKRFLGMASRNVIGKDGIQLQCRAKKGDGLNRKLNQTVEAAWRDWGRRSTCTASGRMTWKQAERLFIRTLIRDGEVLVQKLAARNAHGFTLKFIDVSYLDEMYNETLPSGNRVIMSIEIDSENRAVAYWLTTPSTDIMFSKRQVRTRQRIPADQMIHSFIVNDDESQVRGLTQFHAVLLQGKDLYSFVQAVINSAKMTAMAFGMVSRKSQDGTEYTGAEDDEGNPVMPEFDVQPASILEMPPDTEFTQFDPKQPTQNFVEFKQSMEMTLAAGLEVSGFSLTGDYSQVNYSSARVGLGEERDMWRELQDFVTDEFHREVFDAWLHSSWLSGGVDITPREFNAVCDTSMWRPRGWAYVDPQKEIKAALDGIAGNILTRTDHFAAQGIDLIQWLETKKDEMEAFEEYGIPYETEPPKQLGPAPDAEEPPDPNDPEAADEMDGEEADTEET